jgi:AraC-like DNA-binding protein
MDVLYIPEHRWCENYESDKKPVVEIIQDVESFERDTNNTLIVYLLFGTLSLSYGTVRDYSLTEGDFMLFQPGVKIRGQVKGPVKTLLLRINDRVSLCDKYTLENLYHDLDVTKLRHTHLTSNAIMKAHMYGLAQNIANGLRCIRFMEMKVQELFYYLRAYYPKSELAGFSLPLLSANAGFMDFVWKNYRKAHNVEQFARLANCSLATLETRFKKITGRPAGQWLSEQKARNVYHDICYGQKSLKEISREYHFSSVSHLGTFCRKHFGTTPGNLKSGKD